MLNRLSRKDWQIAPTSGPDRPRQPILRSTALGTRLTVGQVNPRTDHSGLISSGKLASGDGSASSLVPAVERAVALLDVLAEADESVALADLQRRTGFPKSSLHGLLATLTHLGLIYRNDEQRYSLGSKSLQWADAYAHQTRVILAFNEASKSLAAIQEETVMLAVLQGAKVHYLACREGSRPLAVKFRVGGSFPAACTSTGKAILATLSNEQVKALIGEHGLQRQTRFSVPSVDALLKQLDRFRHAGYAIDDEEMAEGMHCFGAPVFTAGKAEAIAAVAVSLIKASTSVKRRQEIIQQVGDLAKDISRRLGAL
jgi:IclR family transcriptional regulator, blcABC operon repressor